MSESEGTAPILIRRSNLLVSMGILELRVLQGNHYYQNLELQRILSE